MPRPRTFMNEDVVEIMREFPEPYVTLGDVASELDKSKSAVEDRMWELLEDDKIKRKKVGANAVVWWLPERTRKPNPAI